MPPVALRLQLMQAVATRAGISTQDFSAFVAQTERSSASGPASQQARPGDPRAPQDSSRRDGYRPARARSAVASSQRPDLTQRVRLLLALHPTLGHESWDPEFLPEPVVRWMQWLATLPEGTRFAGVLEALRNADPGAADILQAAALQDRGLIGDLTLEDARLEFQGACAQLRQQSVRAEIDRLVTTGLADETTRGRYAQLQQWLRTGMQS
jgi:hypothetical protein